MRCGKGFDYIYVYILTLCTHWSELQVEPSSEPMEPPGRRTDVAGRLWGCNRIGGLWLLFLLRVNVYAM